MYGMPVKPTPIRSPKHKLTRSGRGWYKRVVGRVRWVCSAAVATTGAEADAIYEDKFKMLAALPAGRKATIGTPGMPVTLATVMNQFLFAKLQSRDAGKIKPRTYADYTESLKLLGESLGITTLVADLKPGHFTHFAARLAREYGIDRRMLHTVNIRSMFKWAEEMEVIDRRPRYGPEFKMPSRLERRRARAAMRKRRHGLIYSSTEVALLLNRASPKMRALILLMLNGGFRPVELADITWDEINDGWFHGDTGKWAIERDVPLWPETQLALACMYVRKHPPGNSRHVFVAKNGKPYVNRVSQLSTDFWRMFPMDGVRNRGMYSFRRTFRTLADSTNDQRAIARVMGREVGDIDTLYVQHVNPSRMIDVCSAVRAALTESALSGWVPRAVKQRRRWALPPRPVDLARRLPAIAEAPRANT